MAREAILLQWDAMYRSLCDAQDVALRMSGSDPIDLYSALGDARAAAEDCAPAGWSVADIGKLPVSRG